MQFIKFNKKDGGEVIKDFKKIEMESHKLRFKEYGNPPTFFICNREVTKTEYDRVYEILKRSIEE